MAESLYQASSILTIVRIPNPVFLLFSLFVEIQARRDCGVTPLDKVVLGVSFPPLS